MIAWGRLQPIVIPLVAAMICLQMPVAAQDTITPEPGLDVSPETDRIEDPSDDARTPDLFEDEAIPTDDAVTSPLAAPTASSTGLDVPITGETITPFDPAETPTLIRSVLTAAVTKTSEYPIDLPTVLQLVETQNLPLAQTALTAKIQKLAYYRRLSDLLPDVNLTYSQSRFQGVVQIFGSETLTIYQTRYQPQATVRWTVFPGGQTVFEALAARRRSTEARLQTLETLQQQLVEASKEYYTLVEAHIQAQNAQLSIDEAQANVRLNEARFQAGVGTKLDLVRAQSQLAQQERVLNEAEGALSRAEQALLARLNLEPNVHLRPKAIGAQPKVLVPMTASSERLIELAVANHPALQEAAQEIEALENEAKAIWGRLLPAVTMEAYINGVGPSLEQLGLGRFAGFTVETTLFENLGTAFPIDLRSKYLEIKRKKVDWQEQKRLVQTDVVNAFLDSRMLAKSILVSQEDLEASQEAYRLAVGRYRAGLGLFLDVLSAEVALSNARTRMAQAILSFNRAQAELVESLGQARPETLMNGVDPLRLGLEAQPLPVSP